MACFVSCTACARHIRSTEDACPFCGDVSPKETRVCARAAGGRPLSRAAVLFAAAAATTACGKTTGGRPDAPDTNNEGMIAAPYGVPLPPPDAEAVPQVEPKPRPLDQGVPAYGVPPPDKTAPRPKKP